MQHFPNNFQKSSHCHIGNSWSVFNLFKNIVFGVHSWGLETLVGWQGAGGLGSPTKKTYIYVGMEQSTESPKGPLPNSL